MIKLVEAIEEASSVFDSLIKEFGIDLISQDESDRYLLQSDYINFYSAATINYVAIAQRSLGDYFARCCDPRQWGLWDARRGHGPREVIDSLSKNWVMANVMTPSFSQSRLAGRLKKELGHTVEIAHFPNISV